MTGSFMADPTPIVDHADGDTTNDDGTSTESFAAHRICMAELMLVLDRRVQDEDSLLDLLARASREAVRLVDDADWAGVTLRFAGEPYTAAHTDPRVLVVDQGQYEQGDGPSLAAMAPTSGSPRPVPRPARSGRTWRRSPTQPECGHTWRRRCTPGTGPSGR